MTEWNKCQGVLTTAWGEDASPDAQWSVCQGTPTLEWSVCAATPDTDWPTCQLPPDTDWEIPIYELPGDPVGEVLMTQFVPEEVRPLNQGARVSQFTIEETRIEYNPGMRVTQFAVIEIRQSDEY